MVLIVRMQNIMKISLTPLLQVEVEDLDHPGHTLGIFKALSRWMEGKQVHAVDSLDTVNPTCPQ